MEIHQIIVTKKLFMVFISTKKLLIVQNMADKACKKAHYLIDSQLTSKKCKSERDSRVRNRMQQSWKKFFGQYIYYISLRK